MALAFNVNYQNTGSNSKNAGLLGNYGENSIACVQALLPKLKKSNSCIHMLY
jgi:hypothetical protein